MKKYLVLLLVLTLLFSLVTVFTGCEGDIKKKSSSASRSDDDDDDDQNDGDGYQHSNLKEDTEQEEGLFPKPTEPEGQTFSLGETITVEDAVCVTVTRYFTAKDVKPPKPASFYTHYEASQGETYVVVVMDVKHLGENSVDANTLLVPTATVDGAEYTPFILVEENDGAELNRGSSTIVAPLQTVRLYMLYTVPESANTDAITLSANVNGVICTGHFTQKEVSGSIPELSVGDGITDEKTISATLEAVEFTNEVYPPNPTGYYHYYSADNGCVYLVVKMKVKNLKGTDMDYDSIAGISCIYMEKYHYNFSTVFESDNGQDLNSAASLYSISPLGEGTVYYLAEVPAEVENGPVEITLYIAGSYFKICI